MREQKQCWDRVQVYVEEAAGQRLLWKLVPSNNPGASCDPKDKGRDRPRLGPDGIVHQPKYAMDVGAIPSIYTRRFCEFVDVTGC